MYDSLDRLMELGINFMPICQDLLGHGVDAPRLKIWLEKRPVEAGPDVWLNAADSVAQRLVDGHEIDQEARISWSNVAYREPTDFYSGLPGVAFFLAAHSVERENETSSNLAERAIEDCLRQFDETAEEQGPCLGGLRGTAALAYAVARVGHFLERPDWIDRAIELVLSIDARVVRADTRFDVVFGAAGTLLAALAVRSILATDDPRRHDLLCLAESCGDHLLSGRTRDGDGPRAWISEIGSSPLSGFAHGASGIATALAKLNAEVDTSELRCAIEEALDYENTLFVAGQKNWRPSPGELRQPVAWCYGAPGIALARLALLESPVGSTRREPLRRDLDVALETAWAAPKVPFDHVCCGSLSRAEALLTSAERLDSGEDRRAAETIGFFTLRVAKSLGSFRTAEESKFTPSFFHGIAGVGYTYLRLASTAILPSPLLLD